MEDNSAELVIRLQKGDKAAFERIFELYKVKAVRTAYLLTNNKAYCKKKFKEKSADTRNRYGGGCDRCGHL